MSFKVVLSYDTSRVFSFFDLSQVPLLYAEKLREIGAEFVAKDCTTADELIETCHDCDFLITSLALRLLTRDVIARLKKCKFIEAPGIGYDGPDLEALAENGIGIINHPGCGSREVADSAMALILGCSRGTLQLDKMVRAGKPPEVAGPWINYLRRQMPPLMRLDRKTLGILGLGHIGRSLVLRARGFGMKVIAYDPYVDSKVFGELKVAEVDLDRLLEESDFISIHMPLTSKTEHMFGVEEFKKMKRSAFIINTARGGIIDETALCAALAEGSIAGAGLDVTSLDLEPLPANPLLGLSNVILTGHTAGHSVDAEPERWGRPLEEIGRVMRKEWPIGLANPEIKRKYVEKWGPMSEPEFTD